MDVLIFGAGGMSAGIARYLSQDSGTRVREVPHAICDVKREPDVRAQLRRWQPDWVINCAGIDDESNPYDTIQTNLVGALHVATMCGPRWENVPCIQIASVAGLYGKPDHPSYCASKAGVISLVQGLGFTQPIWAISPGRVDTPMREARYPNDTPGSRLAPENVGFVVEDIIGGLYASGSNIIIRKIGADPNSIIEVEEEVNPWKDELRVGQPLTI